MNKQTDVFLYLSLLVGLLGGLLVVCFIDTSTFRTREFEGHKWVYVTSPGRGATTPVHHPDCPCKGKLDD